MIGGAGDGAFAVAGFAQGPGALVMLLAAQCVLAGCNNEATVSADYQRDQIVPRAQTVVTFDDGFPGQLQLAVFVNRATVNRLPTP